MHPLEQAVIHETRRQFFSRTARGLGVAALATMFGLDEPWRHRAPRRTGHRRPVESSALRAQGEAGHLSAHGGRAAAAGPVRLQAGDERLVRQRSAGLDPPGAAADDHDRRARRDFPSRRRSTSSRSTGRAARGCPSSCRTPRRWSTTSRIVKSMHTEQINHEPAITFMQTGSMVGGQAVHRIVAGVRSWQPDGRSADLCRHECRSQQSAHADRRRCPPGCGARGSCRRSISGVSLRAGAEPVLFINNPDGVSPAVRRRMLDALSEMNELQHQEIGDPETMTRIAQYEMAYRMQSSVPELTDLSGEPESTYQLYGEDARRAGSFAQCCLTARRLLERGTRFVQIWLNGWDVHSNATGFLPSQCLDVDQACYGFLQDLKQRGMLDDTLRRLGRRVRTDDLFARTADANQLWPRSPSAVFHHVAGGGRRQTGRRIRRDR